MRRSFYLFLLVTTLSFGQSIRQADLKNPRATLYTHMYFLEEDSFNAAKSSRVFYNLPREEAENYAVKLKEIYYGKGLVFDFTKIPDDPEYTDTIKKNGLTSFKQLEKRYYPFPKDLPDVYVEKRGTNWYYSAETVNAIPALYDNIYRIDFSYFKTKYPGLFSYSVKGIKVWKFMMFFILMGLSILTYWILMHFFRFVFKYLEKFIFKKSDHIKTSIKEVSDLVKPLVYLIIIYLLKLVMPSLHLFKINNFFFLLLNIAATVFWVVFLVRLLRVIVNFYDELHFDSDSKLREQLSPIIIKIINGFIVLVGLLHLITLFGVDPTTVLAGASIGGIAVAFAAQDSVKNLIGTINIFMDKPFQIGDWVEIGTVKGVVERVGLRSTVIRAADTSVFQIPNSKISEADVNNRGMLLYRRYLTELGIRYDTPPELIQGFVMGIREIIKAHPDTHDENYNVEFSGFGDSALNIMVNVFFINLEWGHEQSSKHLLHLAIVKLAKALGVEFAFPSSTVIIEQVPEKNGVQMKYETDAKVIQRSINSVMKEFQNDTKFLRIENAMKEIQ